MPSSLVNCRDFNEAKSVLTSHQYDTNVMQKIDLAKIRSNLKYGDNKKIHQMTGLSLSFISQVLNGKKNSDDVLEAAVKLATDNIARKQAINSLLNDKLVHNGEVPPDIIV